MLRGRGPARARLRGKALLYVDDDRALLNLTARTFERAGGRCRTAANHEDGVRALAEDESLRIAIVDFEMPDGEAADLVERLRSVRPEIIVIGTSGLDHQEDFARCGVERFLPKPWRLEDLLDAAGW